MTFADVERITIDYYSCFCGLSLSGLESGTHFVCSPQRDQELKGFGCKFTIYLLERDDLCVAAYSPKYQAQMERLKLCGEEKIVSEVKRQFPLKEKRLFVFEREAVTDYGEARVLAPEDYPLYENFFREANPNADPEGWLEEYFVDKASKGYFTGYFSEGRLVSVCDGPDMPYMEGTIQHTGIVTLKQERRKGYGLRAAALAAHHLMEMGICPQWECGGENMASARLAKAIGYQEYARAYIMEE